MKNIFLMKKALALFFIAIILFISLFNDININAREDNTCIDSAMNTDSFAEKCEETDYEVSTHSSESIMVYSNNFDDNVKNAFGWYAGYGGEIALSTAKSSSGNRSLALFGRSKSWHSPAINIYDYVRAGGAGTYSIFLKVLVVGGGSEKLETRILLRGTGTNSFIKKYDSNYYCITSNRYTLVEDSWTQMLGIFTVTDSDIRNDNGQFNLMIDVLQPTSGQIVYIDDVEIQKVVSIVPDFSIGCNSIDLWIGRQYGLSATGKNEVYYSSGNPTIATVDSASVITAVSPGTTYIAVFSGEDNRICTVNVKVPTFQTVGISNDDICYIKSVPLKRYLYTDSDSSIYTKEMKDKKKEYELENILFRIDYVGSGLYSITATGNHNGEVLAGSYASKDNNDLWYIVKQANEEYRLINSKNFKVLSVQSSDTQVMLTDNHNDNSLFKILPGPEISNEMQYFGASTTTYGSRLIPTCQNGYRVSPNVIADTFLLRISGNKRSVLFNYQNSQANKSNFMSKKLNSISGNNIDDVDFMMFVGHGLRGSYLHFDYGPNGEKHKATDKDCHMNNDIFCLTNSDAKFGYGNARTKWVLTFTCNYLNDEYISNEELKEKMMGCNIVLGYRTVSYLSEAQINSFVDRLEEGETIIDSWFYAGEVNEKTESNEKILRAMCVEEARNDTLDSYYTKKGTYGTQDIDFVIHRVGDGF